MPNPVLEHLNRNDVTYDFKDVGAERSENKVTAFQVTPDNDHYPSEKLVADGLDSVRNLVTGKEDVANRVSTFQQIPDNAHYPTEKLVYDTIEDVRYDLEHLEVSSLQVVNALPAVAEASENIGYILKTEDGAVLYKLIDNEFVMVGAEAIDCYTTDEVDDMFEADRTRLTAAETTISSHTGSINNLSAQIASVSANMVTDVAGNSERLTVSYQNGTSKNINIKDDSDVVVDVDATEDGIEITFSNGDTKPVPISGGGGGSGGGSGSVIITRITDSTVTYVSGSSCPISYYFEARDSGGDLVGSGSAEWYVGNVRKATSQANQGNNTFDIANYLSVGANNVRLVVTVDTGGETPLVIKKTWTVNLINMYIVWNYDDATINTGDTFTIRWTPYGDLSKTTYMIVDNAEPVAINTTSRTGVEQFVTLQKLAHGSHRIQLYCTATVGSQPITSNVVVHDMIFVDESSSLPVIGCSLATNTLRQYDTIAIPIVVYTPGSMNSHVVLSVDGVTVADWPSVDRTVHYWNYSPNTSGAKSLAITSGATSKVIPITVSPIDIDNEEVGGYSFKLKAADITGNDMLRNWNSNGVTATFSSNFDWNNGGMHVETDENGNLRQYICVKAGTRMTLNHQLFADDATMNGKTFKMIFKVKNCRDYDAFVAGCMADDIGIQLNAHEAVCRSSGTSVSVPYGEDEYIELEFDVYAAPRTENDGNYRYIMAWIDGVITTVRVYSASDNFTQTQLQNFVIGSDDCDVYVYMVKAYSSYLTRDNHMANFIADAPNAQEMVARYDRNDILDVAGQIDYEKLSIQNPDLRVWLYDIPRLTQGKKDKVENCQFQQIWVNGDPYYQLTGTGTMTIQGTSSVDYLLGAANTDINFAGGELRDGNGNDLLDDNLEVKGFKINDNSVPITYSNTKVNFASCEQVNNMCNAEWYQQFQPYQRVTPRDCMEFEMGVQFIHDQSGDLFPDDNKFHMYSIANMGTSKKNVHVFHDTENENEVCIEVNNNLNDQCRMISDDLTGEDWSGDRYFGMRYPDTKNPSQAIRNGWQRFLTWMATNNPNAATNLPLPSAVTYGVYTFRGHSDEGSQVLRGTTVKQYAGTYTQDTFEYRMAKMLNECEDYMIMDSVVYHFLMLERHTMVDNVSKNSFWSSRDLLHWDLSKAYDMDTSDGNNNEGQMVFDYGNEADDIIGSKTVFNAADSVWFIFISHLYEACQTMFIDREAATATIDGELVYGAWNKDAYHRFLTRQQKKVPERVWNQCYWYDYLRTYEDGINSAWMSFLDGGQKTHQRWHYETFQEAYESSKYRGIACTSQNVTIRAYTPSVWTGVQPKSELKIKMYNKMYIVVKIDQIFKSVKAERGQLYTIDFSDIGTLNDTVINLYTAQMIQEIGDLSPLYPGHCSFALASRLRSLQIGSSVSGYSNTNLEDLAFDNNPMLEYLYVQNLPNAESGLNLMSCKALKVLDARGSAFTSYDFATGADLMDIKIEAPVSLTLRDLQYLDSAHLLINNYNRLTTLRFENCPDVDAAAIVNAAVNLNRARIINIFWETYYTSILNRLIAMIGMDDGGYNTPLSVLTGRVDITGPVRQRELDSYDAWGDELEINYDSSKLVPQFRVDYRNADGSTLYVDYVDRGAVAIDPVQQGLIDTPTQASTAQYDYTFSGWDNLEGGVTAPKIVTALYETSLRTYRVEWYEHVGDITPRQIVTQAYGTEAVYTGDRPVDISGEGGQVYRIFSGWDKSTGSIEGDMKVYAQWDECVGVPSDKPLDQLTPVEVYAVCAAQQAGELWEVKDHIDVTLGTDYEFSNVESRVLLQNRYFDGSTGYATDIQLFTEDSPSFTLAVDYELLSTNGGGATIVSCCNDYNTEIGFRLYWNNHPQATWYGSNTLQVGSGSNRNMIVIRHVKGSPNLIFYSFNTSTNLTRYSDTLTISERYGGISPDIPYYLSFGGIYTDGNSFDYQAKGWVYWSKIWFADLGDTVCQKLAAWPHETLRMEFAGANRQQLANSSGYANGSFIANNLLPLYHNMNASSSSVHGWGEMHLRSFLQDRVFAAFSESWQSAIKQVRTRGLRASNSQTIIVSKDYLYLPTYADLGITTSEPYISELTYGVAKIPFFTNQNSRIKYTMILEDRETGVPGHQVIQEDSDPTLLSRYTIREGDQWFPTGTSTYRYVYISRDTALKHTRFGVHDLTAANTNIGSSVYQASDGGLWILPPSYWWTKTPYYYEGYTSDQFYAIATGGGTAITSTSNFYSICICFNV